MRFLMTLKWVICRSVFVGSKTRAGVLDSRAESESYLVELDYIQAMRFPTLRNDILVTLFGRYSNLIL